MGTGTTLDLGATFGTGMGTIVDNIMAMVAVVLPLGLGILGVYIAIGAGKKIVKMFSK